MLDRPKTALVVIWIVALIPMVHLTYLVRHYGVEVPTLDDWEMAPLIVKAHTGQLKFADLFEQQEEARTVLPKLIFVLSAAGGHWDVRDQMLLSVISCWLTAAGVFLLLRRSGLNLITVAISFWLSALLIFSPAQYELWIFASGFPSFLPALFLVAALLAIGAGLSTLWKFVICFAVAVVSTFTLPHGMLAWALTFPVLLLGRRLPRWRWWLAGWLVACGLWVAAYFSGYHKPDYLPAFAPAVAPSHYARFFLEFLGGGLAYSWKNQTALAATLFGALQLLLFGAALAYSAPRLRDRVFSAKVLPWFALGLYALGSALLATLGRVQYGPDYALASRYVTFSIWLTIALCALFAIIGNQVAATSTRARVWVWSIASVLIISFLIPYKAAAANTRFFLRSLAAKDQLGRAAVLFSGAMDTSGVIDKTIYPKLPGTAVRNAAALDQLKLLRPPLLRTNHLGALPHQAAGGQEAFGSCENLEPDEAGATRASGWAVLPQRGRPADCVAIAYQTPVDPEPVLFAISDSFEMRPKIVKRFRNMDLLWSGWSATFQKNVLPAGAKLSFWAVDAESPRLYEISDKCSPTRP